MKKIIFLFWLVYPLTTFSQKLNHKTEYDIDKDNIKELLLFYDEFDGEFEKTEFSKFCLTSEGKTYCVENKDVWVEQTDLYKLADKEINKRLGLLFEHGKVFVWLTGFPYGCCLNKTTILEWTGDSLLQIFSTGFELKSIEIINGIRYLIGISSLREQYGDREDFYFTGFYPIEYLILKDGMKVDKDITQERNLKFKTIENNISVYDATIVHVNYTNEDIMISKRMETSLDEREFGILSLIKLNKDYFKSFSKAQLRLMRNELFAYHGYSFNSKDLHDYFKREEWYKPTKKTSDMISSEFTEIEKYNIELIQGLEKGLN